MKNFLVLFLALSLLGACSEKKENTSSTNEKMTVEETEARTQTQPQFNYDEKVISFNKDNLEAGCNEDSKMACAVNLALKCTINPYFSECEKNKLPKFIFMEDESLDRPTFASYKINKIKPLSDGTVEVYTESDCNGQWFGLCKGNIIYVLSNREDQWVVKDLYALQQF